MCEDSEERNIDNLENTYGMHMQYLLRDAWEDELEPFLEINPPKAMNPPKAVAMNPPKGVNPPKRIIASKLQEPDKTITCIECSELIKDKYVLRVKEEFWHPTCLKCAVCQQELGAEKSCYMKSGKVFCKDDYTRQFRLKYSVKCSCCQRAIQETDWVRKAKQHVYHLACFACEVCKRQLSTGEEFALIDHKLLCKLHYIEKLESPSTPGSNTVVPVVLNSSGNESDISSHGSSIRDSMMVEEAMKTHSPNIMIPDNCIFSDEEERAKRKANEKFGFGRSKRVRTSFTDEQLQILQANFDLDPNPDAAELERVSTSTGLSKRVTQVWFQNSRARQKKQGNYGRLIVSSPSGNVKMEPENRIL